MTLFSYGIEFCSRERTVGDVHRLVPLPLYEQLVWKYMWVGFWLILRFNRMTGCYLRVWIWFLKPEDKTTPNWWVVFVWSCYYMKDASTNLLSYLMLRSCLKWRFLVLLLSDCLFYVHNQDSSRHSWLQNKALIGRMKTWGQSYSLLDCLIIQRSHMILESVNEIPSSTGLMSAWSAVLSFEYNAPSKSVSPSGTRTSIM